MKKWIIKLKSLYHAKIGKQGESFTSEEDQIILEKKGKVDDIANKLGRTKPSVANRRVHLLMQLQGQELSKKEEHIFILISRGLTDQDIGKLIGRSKRTVETYRKNIILKLKARNIAHAVRIGFTKRILKIKQ